MKKPRILHVTHELSAGGAERVVTDLATHLAVHGFDVGVVAVLRGGLFEDELRGHGIPVTVLSREGILGSVTLRRLRALFRREKPDIVHTHLFLADTWGRIAASLARVPAVVSTEHNVNVSYGAMHHMVNRALVGLTDRFVAVSDEVSRVMAGHGIPQEKIVTIRNGVDLDRIRPRPRRPFHDPPRIIVVARFFPQKNHELLFRALARVKEPWRLRLAGEGPLERHLRALAERLNIAPRIEWLGVRNDVPDLLAEADLCCFPSRWEGLGLAAVEAAAAGVPLIASDLAPLREVFTDADATFVPPEDVAAWASSIAYALSHPDEILARADRTLAKTHATMGLHAMVARHAELYRSLLDSV
jgi:glycosyltransferase involved in cell wall biosynthesis